MPRLTVSITRRVMPVRIRHRPCDALTAHSVCGVRPPCATGSASAVCGSLVVFLPPSALRPPPCFPPSALPHVAGDSCRATAVSAVQAAPTAPTTPEGVAGISANRRKNFPGIRRSAEDLFKRPHFMAVGANRVLSETYCIGCCLLYVSMIRLMCSSVSWFCRFPFTKCSAALMNSTSSGFLHFFSTRMQTGMPVE